MNKQINFKVSLSYQVFSGEPDAVRLARQLSDFLESAIEKGGLNLAKSHNTESLDCVEPLVVGYSVVEVNTILLVSDEFNKLFSRDDRQGEIVDYLRECIDLNCLARQIGAMVADVWKEINSLGFEATLAVIPKLLRNVYANNGELPTDNRAAWLNGVLSILEIDPDEYAIKKLAHENPEFVVSLRAAANNFKAAVDLAGADKLSEFTGQASGSILAELTALAEKFK